jgi:hypothetical protein
MKRSLIAAGAALAATVALAPLAQASPTDYDQYMISHGEVAGAGANCSSAPCGYSSEYLLQQGKAACAAFAQGVSDASLTAQLEGAPGSYSQSLDMAVSSNIVHAAHQYLCP